MSQVAADLTQMYYDSHFTKLTSLSLIDQV